MPYKNLDKVLLFLKKPGILSENLKTDKLQLSYSSIFFAETSHTFSTYHCLKKCVHFFNFIQILSYLQKLKKT